MPKRPFCLNLWKEVGGESRNFGSEKKKSLKKNRCLGCLEQKSAESAE